MSPHLTPTRKSSRMLRRNAFKHGRYTAEAIEARRAFSALLRRMKDAAQQAES